MTDDSIATPQFFIIIIHAWLFLHAKDVNRNSSTICRDDLTSSIAKLVYCSGLWCMLSGCCMSSARALLCQSAIACGMVKDRQ
jgi:hypothetical protein